MVNLKKGQKISLTKEDAGLRRIMVGLGWDEAPQVRHGLRALFMGKPPDIDCDASAILCGEDGRLVGGKDFCIYFGNLQHPSGAIVHRGDNLTGGGEGDDEQIMVDLSLLPKEVAKIVFVVNIYDANVRGQHFGMIRNAFIRLVDADKNKELCIYNLSENYAGTTALVFGELYRYKGEWKFNAVGQPLQVWSIAQLAERYGLPRSVWKR